MNSIPFAKRANEYRIIGFRYLNPELVAGTVTISASAVTISPSAIGGLAVSGSVSITDNVVAQLVTGGVAGTKYSVAFLTTLSSGEKYEDVIEVSLLG